MLFGKSKISQQGPAIAHKYIRQFEVPMQEISLCHLYEPTHDILGQLEDVTLRQFPFLLESNTQVSLVAVLSDDIAMGGLPDDIITTQDIRMLQTSECLDLAI